MGGTKEMSKMRVWIVHLAIFVIVSGSFYCIVADATFFPFSNYPMFADLYKPGPRVRMRMYGVVKHDPPREIPLKYNFTYPFGWTRLEAAFSRMLAQPDRQNLLSEALSDFLRRYDMLRNDGHHRGPALQGVRLYQLTWDYLDPWTPPSQAKIVRRELLAEVVRSVKRKTVR